MNFYAFIFHSIGFPAIYSFYLSILLYIFSFSEMIPGYFLKFIIRINYNFFSIDEGFAHATFSRHLKLPCKRKGPMLKFNKKIQLLYVALSNFDVRYRR